jgi:pteridine reductase
VGAAICRALARSRAGESGGAHVVLTFRSSADEAAGLVEEIGSLGGSAEARRLDLDDLGSLDGFARELLRDHGRLDALVHNASIYEPVELGSITPEACERNLRTHAAAPLLLTQALAPALRRSKLAGGGSVVMMLDIHALGRPRKGFAAYAMSKAALAELVPHLARELAPGARVNGVAPGAVLFAEQGPDADAAMQARYLSRVPLGRAGTAEEAAEAVRWLTFDATYTTGQVVRVDGGRWVT